MFDSKKTLDQVYEEKLKALVEKILYLFSNNNDVAIRGLIKNQPINLLVEALESLDDINILLRFLVISYKIKMGELFLSLTQENKLRVLENIKSGVLSYLLTDLNSDDVYEIFSVSPANIQKKIMFNSSKELKDEIKQLKSFDFAQAGSIMNTTFITFLEGMKVGEALNYLKLKKDSFDIEEEIYVLNSDEEVLGVVKTKELMFVDSRTSLLDLMDKSFLSIQVSEDIDEVIELFKKYSVNSVAVINEENKIEGIIHYKDVIPEILDSNVEDLYKFYGIKDIRKPYLSSGVWEIAKSRIWCLIIMLFAATFTTFVIDKFEHLGVQWTAGISSAILVPIIPIITDMCGNTGSQTTATVIQALASGDIKHSDFWKVARKEIQVSVVVGAILALCNFFRLVFYFMAFPVDKMKIHTNTSILDSVLPYLTDSSSGAAAKLTEANLFKIGMVGALSSSLSLFFVVVFSKFFGVLIPFVAIKFDYDPASISAPVLTTILDTVSSLIFFGIGVFLLYYSISPIFGVSVTAGKLSGSS